ncbi:hypothetical protein O163_01450 [Caldanaerobacter subterraneus subsp. yonseiensis KB-1]|uniref:Uncharacterized protein n=1 Tax=Caldanaerobacter subterraneus subsp. yonseiensis KB-1 TaxID=1388761 RepID=U5CTQ6_CALSX|nr:hypothetical protein O163_01450 [Caldanaerobacter subterraneus subsp. yonseiensis KB-1]
MLIYNPSKKSSPKNSLIFLMLFSLSYLLPAVKYGALKVIL